MRRSHGPGWRGVLLAGTALTLAPTAPYAQAPTARPQGGVVVAGQAQISQTPTATTVTQSSARAIVEWRGFDVGAAHGVTFAQPGSSAVVLNRVTGPDPSAIAGRISANGQVVIINRNGVVFSEGAKVDAAGLVVSTANIANRDFMAGRMAFSEPGKPGARVENRGTITIREAGIAALVAPQVANSGTIRARMGRVVLAGAETHTLDLYGDGLVSLDVGAQVRRTPDGGTALVTNTGTIEAEGGTVLLTATAAEGLVSTLVRAGGRIDVGNPAGTAGTIALRGTGGEVRVEGVASATGARGGAVTAVADRVAVAAGARIDASGRSGGGRIDIGETRPGTPAPQAAQRVEIARGASISADATAAGDGGAVRVMADRSTTHAGAISARGGPQGGDGGFVEVSSRGGMSWTGTVDVTAAMGAAGMILLDPKDIRIVAGTAGDQDDGLVTIGGNDGTLDAGTNPADDPDRPVLVTTGLLNSLAGNVVLQATDTITVEAPIARSGHLELQAGGLVTVNAAIASSGGVRIDAGSITIAAAVDGGSGPVALVATGAVQVNAQLTGGGISLTGSGIALAAPVFAGSGTVALAAGAGGISQTAAGTITAGPLALTSQGAIFLPAANSLTGLSFAMTGNAAVRVNAATGYAVTSGSTTAGSVHLSAGGTLAVQAGVAVGGSAVTLAGQGLDLHGSIAAGAMVSLDAGTGDLGQGAGTITGGGLQLQAGGAITLSGGVLATAGTLNATAGGAILQTGGSVTAGMLTGSAGGAVSLRAGGNSIGQVAGFGGSGDFALHAGDRVLAAIGLGSRGTVWLGARQVTLPGGLAATTRISLQADAIAATMIAAPTVEAAPYAAGPMHVGPGGFDPGLLAATALTLGSTDGITTATRIDIDTPLAISGLLRLHANGPIAQTQAIAAGALLATGTGITLDHPANTIPMLVGLGAGSDARLHTTGNLQIQGLATVAGTATLAAGGAIATLSGGITAGTLTGSAGTGADFGTTNTVATLGPFDAGSGALGLGNTGALALTGAIAGSQVLLSTTAGAITQANAGGNTITTPLLGIAQSGGVTLAGANQIARFAGIAASGGITLRSSDVVLAGHVATPGALHLAADAAMVRLDPGGRVSAGTLSLSAAFGAALDNPANAILALGTVSGGLGNVTIRTGTDLAVTGLVDVPGTLTLHAGTITQSGTGRIVTTRLQGSAAAIALGGPGNAIAVLGGFGSVAGDVEIATTGGMTVAGATSAADLRLSTAGQLAVNDDIAASGTAALSVDGLAIGAAGSVTAPVVALAPRSTGRVVIGTDPAAALAIDAANLNRIVASSVLRIGAPTADPGDITATRIDIAAAAALGGAATLDLRTTGDVAGGGLTVSRLTGAIGGALRLDTAFGNIATLGDMTVGGDLAIRNIGVLDLAGTITVGGSANLVSFSGLSQSAGSLAATQLTVATLSGPVSLGQPGNAIGTLTSASVGGTLALTSAGPLAVQGNVSATTLTLISGGALTQPAAPGNAINAQLLQGSAVGGMSLLGANTIGRLGTLATGGALSLRNIGNLVLEGHVDAGAGAARFDMTGTLSQAGSGRLTAARLEGTVGSLALGGAGNAVATLGGLALGAGGALLRTGGDLVLTGHLDAPGRTVALHAGGTVTQGGAGRITAGLLEGSAATLALDGAGNAVAALGDYAAAADLALATTTALGLTGAVTAADVVLAAGGGVTQAGAASITSGTLRLDAGGAVMLPGANRIGDLAGLAAGGNVLLANAQALRITAPVTLPGHVLTLALGGALTQTAALDADRLTGSVAGALALDDPANRIARAGGLAATGPVTLVTDGSLLLDGALEAAGQAVSLSATGALAQAAAGVVADTLFLSAGSGFALTGANDLAVLGDASSGTGDAALRTIGALALAGHLDAGSQAVALTIGGALTTTGGRVTAGRLTGSAGAITLDAAANAIARIGDLAATGDIAVSTQGGLVLDGRLAAPGHTLRLITGGALTQPAAPDHAITARRLEGAATGGVSLLGANTIGQLGDVATGGAFALRNLGDLVLEGHLDTGTAAATFDIAGALSQAGGRLTAGRLDGTVGSLALGGAGNAVGATGDLAVQAGDAHLRTGGALALTGHLDASGRGMVLDAGGAVTQGPAGRLSAALLEGSAATLALDGAGNAVAALGDYATAGSLSLATGGGLALIGAVTATDVALATAGSVAQASAASIAAGTLRLEAGGAVALRGANRIGDLAGLVAGGDVLLTNAQALRITAPVTLPGHVLTLAIDGSLTQTATLDADRLTGRTAGALVLDDPANRIARAGGLTATGPVTLATDGPLRLDGALEAAGQAVSLTAIGAITQGADGITAHALTLSAGSGFALAGANDVAVLGDAASGTGDAALRTIGALTLAGHLDAGSHALALDIGGALATAGGRVTAGRLTGNAAAIALDAPDNAIARIGDLAATGDASIATTGDAILDGVVRAATLSLRSGGSLTQLAGHVAAGTLRLETGGAATLDGANTIGALGDSRLRGALRLTETDGLVLAGHVDAAGQDVRIHAGGALGGPGSLAAATLAGRFAGLSLTGANAIAALGDITAAGDVTLLNSGALRLTGHLDAAGHGVALATGAGGIGAGPAGRITADSFRTQAGGSTGSIVLAGANAVARLGPVALRGGDLVFASDAAVLLVAADMRIDADGSVTLTATQGALHVAGPVAAGGSVTLAAPLGELVVTAPGLVASGGSILLHGRTVESGAAMTAGRDIEAEGEDSLRIGGALEAGGAIRLSAPDVLLDGVSARGQDLYLQLFGGLVDGAVDAGRLILVGPGGIGAMTGSVGGIFGQAAATRVERETIDGNPLPATPDDRRLLMNGCPVRTINCSVIPGASAIPPGSPLRDVAIMAAQAGEQDEDVQLPGIAARDY